MTLLYDDNDHLSMVFDSRYNALCSAATKSTRQVAQLSQRDRAAGWVTLAKSGNDILQTIFNHCDVIGLQSYRIRWNKAK